MKTTTQKSSLKTTTITYKKQLPKFFYHPHSAQLLPYKENSMEQTHTIQQSNTPPATSSTSPRIILEEGRAAPEAYEPALLVPNRVQYSSAAENWKGSFDVPANPGTTINIASNHDAATREQSPPNHISLRDLDNCTVASAITTDWALKDEEAMSGPPSILRRPQVSLGGDDPLSALRYAPPRMGDPTNAQQLRPIGNHTTSRGTPSGSYLGQGNGDTGAISGMVERNQRPDDGYLSSIEMGNEFSLSTRGSTRMMHVLEAELVLVKEGHDDELPRDDMELRCEVVTSRKKLCTILLIVMIIIVGVVIGTIKLLKVNDEPSPPPPMISHPEPDGVGTCGDGDIGNGVCTNIRHCCSEFGYCGTTNEYCRSSTSLTTIPTTTTPTRAPTILDDSAMPSSTPLTTSPTSTPTTTPTMTPTRAPAIADDSAMPSSTPLTTSPTSAPTTTPCDFGIVGNGICLDGRCCSKFGWCGDGPEYCPTSAPTPISLTTSPTSAPTTTPCDFGFVGNGICLNGRCCSKFGWCGDGPEYCGSQAEGGSTTAGPSVAPAVSDYGYYGN